MHQFSAARYQLLGTEDVTPSALMGRSDSGLSPLSLGRGEMRRNLFRNICSQDNFSEVTDRVSCAPELTQQSQRDCGTYVTLGQ